MTSRFSRFSSHLSNNWMLLKHSKLKKKCWSFTFNFFASSIHSSFLFLPKNNERFGCPMDRPLLLVLHTQPPSVSVSSYTFTSSSRPPSFHRQQGPWEERGVWYTESNLYLKYKINATRASMISYKRPCIRLVPIKSTLRVGPLLPTTRSLPFLVFQASMMAVDMLLWAVERI